MEFAKSKHQVYVTYQRPSTTPTFFYSPTSSPSYRRESHFYWACKGAFGLAANENSIINNIFDNMFARTPKDLQRIDPDTGEEEKEIDPATGKNKHTLKFSSGNQLFKSARQGMCAPWAILFRDTAAVHGISLDVVDVIVPTIVTGGAPGSIYVKEQTISNDRDDPFTKGVINSGQGGAQVNRAWPHHTICRRYDACYDASYGLRATSPALYEAAAFAGYTQTKKVYWEDGDLKSIMKAYPFDGINSKLDYTRPNYLATQPPK